MRSAHMNLREGDPDSAVNRAYYAMFNVARRAGFGPKRRDAKRARTG
jgi:uncharacterized protein (UPF0332 family)